MSIENRNKKNVVTEPIECGVIMPISSIGECSDNHWAEVLQIISDSVSSAGFAADLVSNADETTVIQKTIVQNIYNKPIVVCDVSEKNANVMFELGLRLAFDKPTIIIKDDCTSYSFDTGTIEHVDYPRDLRFSKIVEFKQKLAQKVKATYEKSVSDENYSTFLSHYGQFKVAHIEQKEISSDKYIIDQLERVNSRIERLIIDGRYQRNRDYGHSFRDRNNVRSRDGNIDICAFGIDLKDSDEISMYILDNFGVESVRNENVGDHIHMIFKLSSPNLHNESDIISSIRKMIDLKRVKS
jgi:hypothetical protein